MNNRFKLGLILGLAIVLLALIGYGSTRFIRAATTFPGSNCTAASDTVVSVEVTQHSISTSLSSISPTICFRYLVTNHDQQADDFFIEPQGSSSALVGLSNLAVGQTRSFDYQFTNSQSGTPVELVDTLTGQQAVLNMHTVYLER